MNLKSLFKKLKNQNLKTNFGFTLIEMMISITLFSILIVMAFDAMGGISLTRVKVGNRLDINQDLYYAIETLSSQIKDFGGDIDYEEYWNRSKIGTTTMSGHYMNFSGYGNYGSGGNISTQNYGSGFYYCASGIGTSMGTGGCNNSSGSTLFQRFGEYQFQFIDYNSNMNDDTTNCGGGKPLGDEDCDGNIRGDDDDENLGEGPVAFSGNEVKELYLIKKGKTNERFYLRLNIIRDTNAPTSANCDFNTGSGSACLGNIQILKLTGKDIGISHTGSSSGKYDGIIDTWECNKDFSCIGTNNLPNNIDDGWVNLLPDYVNVKNLKLFLYPDKDLKYSWKEQNDTININSQIRINITLGFSRERRKKLNMTNPELNTTTTINLTKN